MTGEDTRVTVKEARSDRHPGGPQEKRPCLGMRRRAHTRMPQEETLSRMGRGQHGIGETCGKTWLPVERPLRYMGRQNEVQHGTEVEKASERHLQGSRKTRPLCCTAAKHQPLERGAAELASLKQQPPFSRSRGMFRRLIARRPKFYGIPLHSGSRAIR